MPGEKIPRRYRGIPRANWELYDMARDAFRAGLSYGDYVAKYDPPPPPRPKRRKKEPSDA